MTAQVSIRSLSERGVGFGTSGVRATVEALTDEVCFAYAAAFLGVLEQRGPARGGARTVALGHDLRPSSPRMAAACIAACAAKGARVVLCGALPTPALAHFAIQRGLPAIVITGSHIPFDRNGIKFYTSAGEILKDDETAIAAATVELDETAFDRGMLRNPPALPGADPAALDLYRQRYLTFFPAGTLRGRRIGVYEHSSVARDVATDLLRTLGAEVVSLGRTDTFVPVDTEAVSEADQLQGQAWARAHRLDAIVSTDGDADRPLIADETGTWLRGDLVGMLCARFVGARTVVTPVSSNTAVERWGVFPKVIRTRIGSPYVLAAMADAARGGEAPVVGYEANGGFLLGSAVERGGGGRAGVHPPPQAAGSLAALPTRDALLPILSLLAMAAERGAPLSRLSAGLPARFTASDRLQSFETARSRQLLAQLASGPGALSAFFGDLGQVAEVNQVDGLRVTLASGDIVHLRPSGNAPELRCYGEADAPERAAELVRWGLAAAARSGRMP
ncbi:MAG TPA: phosphomannomutase [Anaeromyxobacteraceae bacterium]